MREAGRVVAHALEAVTAAVRPGASLSELDVLGEETIRGEGATPSFLGYHPHFAPGPFPGTLCLSPNNVIVHGIPDRYRLREGDLLSIDCGAIIEGYHGDAAVTVPVGEVSDEAAALLKTTEASLRAAIEQIREGNRLSDIGHAVQEVAEAAGYSVVREYVGHGIGQAMHEDPQVPNYGPGGRGPLLRTG